MRRFASLANQKKSRNVVRPALRQVLPVPSPLKSKVFFRIPLAVFLLDRFTKFLALSYLSRCPTVPILPGIFHLTLVRNSGIAFGLFQGWGFGVSLVTLLVLTAFIASALRQGQMTQTVFCWGLGLVLGGAAGNLLDRIRWGAVIDFLDFRIWPVFNVADGCVVIGAVLMGWTLIRKGPQ